MIVKTRAIVLRITKFGDSQIIVDVLTEEQGRVAFMVRLSKSSKSKFRRQYFQPLTLLDIEYDYRQKANLQKMKDLMVASPYCDIPFSPVKLSMSMFLAEFISLSTRNEQENFPLFAFVVDSLLWLDGASGNFANFHIVFMLRMTLFLGFYPNLEDDEQLPFFDLQEGCFVAHAPAHPHFLAQEDTVLLRKLMRIRYRTMHLYQMSRTERNRCVDLVLQYYRLHVPNFPDMKTLPILKELFA